MSIKSLFLFGILFMFVLLPTGQSLGQNMTNTTTGIFNNAFISDPIYYQRDTLRLANNSQFEAEDASCDRGDFVLGGGYSIISTIKGVEITED